MLVGQLQNISSTHSATLAGPGYAPDHRLHQLPLEKDCTFDASTCRLLSNGTSDRMPCLADLAVQAAHAYVLASHFTACAAEPDCQTKATRSACIPATGPQRDQACSGQHGCSEAPGHTGSSNQTDCFLQSKRCAGLERRSALPSSASTGGTLTLLQHSLYPAPSLLPSQHPPLNYRLKNCYPPLP